MNLYHLNQTSQKKSKERQGSKTNAVEACTADGLFSVCLDAYSGRAAKMGGTGAMESERKIEDITWSSSVRIQGFAG